MELNREFFENMVYENLLDGLTVIKNDPNVYYDKALKDFKMTFDTPDIDIKYMFIAKQDDIKNITVTISLLSDRSISRTELVRFDNYIINQGVTLEEINNHFFEVNVYRREWYIGIMQKLEISMTFKLTNIL